MPKMNQQELQARIAVAKFHQWLGLNVTEVTEEGIVLTASWREEWIVNP
ncbi:MAG: phenylacetic acid degradation protein, partial [Burkholderiales bacterium]|nr:phenylacetic acid degradation protein [Burkholderiales bacterium]